MFRASASLLRHRKRTHHFQQQWEKDKGNYLTAYPRNLLMTRPNLIPFPERVDAPLVPPKECTCFNCTRNVDVSLGNNSYVWVPSGNAKKPTPVGYFFHRDCFKCHKCKFVFGDNIFYSKGGKALCLECAMGQPPKAPAFEWYFPYVEGAQFSSRGTGHMFPRHKHQLEYLLDPEK